MELIDLPVEIIAQIFCELPWLSLKAFIKCNKKLEQVLNNEYFWTQRYRFGTFIENSWEPLRKFNSFSTPNNMTYKEYCIKLELGHRKISVIETSSSREYFHKLGQTKDEALNRLTSLIKVDHNVTLACTNNLNQHRLYIGEKCKKRGNSTQQLQSSWHGFPFTDIARVYVIYNPMLSASFKQLMNISNNYDKTIEYKYREASDRVRKFIDEFITTHQSSLISKNI